MKSLHVEIFLGHDTGLNENYYRPSEEDLLNDYLKALPDLTFLEYVRESSLDKIEELEKDNLELRQELNEIKEQVKLLGEMMAKRNG